MQNLYIYKINKHSTIHGIMYNHSVIQYRFYKRILCFPGLLFFYLLNLGTLHGTIRRTYHRQSKFLSILSSTALCTFHSGNPELKTIQTKVLVIVLV